MSIVQKIQAIVKSKHVLQHPFYQDWMEGKLSIQQLQNYAQQYLPFVDAFPRFVSSAHSLCENAVTREMLLDNLMDEEGKSYSEPHPKLWRDFQAGLGDQNFLTESYAFELRDTFMKLCRSSYEEAVCALYAYESQIPTVSKAKIEGLDKNYGISEEKTTRFFAVHEKADVYHSQACEKMMAEIPDERTDACLLATQIAVDALWKFLSDVHFTGRTSEKLEYQLEQTTV